MLKSQAFFLGVESRTFAARDGMPENTVHDYSFYTHENPATGEGLSIQKYRWDEARAGKRFPMKPGEEYILTVTISQGAKTYVNLLACVPVKK